MVMPVETACPCRTKFIAMPCPGGLLLLAFAELIAYQLQDCVDRSLRVGAVRLDRDARALARREHHHPHDAFRVDPAPVARDPDVAGEGARRLRQLRRGARVQAERMGGGAQRAFAEVAVLDQKNADHQCLPILFSRASRNIPETSNPVWSWISRKQVGLVTFTSVSQSPITSRPTRSRPLFD